MFWKRNVGCSLGIPLFLLCYFIKTCTIFFLSCHTHLLKWRFHRCFTWVPSAGCTEHYDNPANCHLSIPCAKQSKISPELLIHLRCIMAYIWDQLFVAFEASRWADGTWDHVGSHEFMMCFVSPAPPCCRAQTAADVIECTFVNIYPGEEPMKLREVHSRWRRWQSGRYWPLNQPVFSISEVVLKRRCSNTAHSNFTGKAWKKFKPKL